MTNSDMIDLTPAVKELYAALDGKVTEDVLRSELERYIITYKIGITTAKDSIIKKYSGSRPSGTFVSSAAVTKKIGDLEGTEMKVNIVAKMVFVEKKEVMIKNVPTTIISGIAGDDTGTVPFTIWSDMGEFEKGAVYTFSNGYTKLWNGNVQFNIGRNGKVEPNNETSFNVQSSGSFSGTGSAAQDYAIGDITEQTKSVNVTGRISNVQSRIINVKGEERTVWGGIIADSTGKVQFNSWNDFQLQDGETINIKNAYIRAWKGIPQINLSDRTTVTRVEGDIGVISNGPSCKTVEEVMKIGGGLDITVTGTIVDVRTGSGLIKRCPQCKRSMLGEDCNLHGRVEPVLDLRLKLTIDDGTGAISAIINCKDTEKITGITLAVATELAKEKCDMSIVGNRMGSVLLLKKIAVTGNIMTDEYGPQMSVHSTELVTTDLMAEAEKLYNEVEGCL